MVVVFVLVFAIGIGTILSLAAGLARMSARAVRIARRLPPTDCGLVPADVAVLVAAHDEELVIAQTIRSATRLVPAAQVFVVSDGSGDRTADIARDHGARVLELNPNRGKAGALAEGIRHFRLDERFEVVLLLDADSQLSPDYLDTGLPLFADPNVVAVAGWAATLANPQPPAWLGRVLIGYRERVYTVIQYLQKYGHAARWLNAVSIVPGFASMYRARVLADIDIAARGLVIEDYNMTFEVHAKRLGRIAFHPRAAVAYTQDPATLRDYVHQVGRWSLGFWQTVRRHGLFHLGGFWAVLWVLLFDTFVSSLVALASLPLLAVLGAAWGLHALGFDPTGAAGALVDALPPLQVLAGLLLPEAAFTLFTAAVTRSAIHLAAAPAYPFLRMVDAALCLRSFARALRPSAHTGQWVSPGRRALAAAPSPATLTSARPEPRALPPPPPPVGVSAASPAAAGASALPSSDTFA